jgi:hypothetical protein
LNILLYGDRQGYNLKNKIMANQTLDLKNYNLKHLTNLEGLDTNGGFWGVIVAAIEYAWELKYDNSVKQGYDDARNLFLNNKYKK